MDNTAQNQVQTYPAQPPPSMPVQPAAPIAAQQAPQSVPVIQPPVESITEPLSTDVQPSSVLPSAPVSLSHREAGPGLGKMSEFVKPTEVAPVLSSEVKEAGVEVSPDREQPVIPASVAQLGVQPAKAAVPVQAVTGAKVEYLTDAPFTQVEAQKIEKSHRARESIRWLATFLLKQIKKIKLIAH